VPSLSIVIPVYNSEGSIGKLVDVLAETLPTITQQYEVILVEDDSRDNSWQAIEAMADQYDWVHGYKLMRNYGQHNALLCGIRAAQYDVVVTMDDDLQHHPSKIPVLLAKLEDGYDVVYGSPEKEQHTLFRNLASQMTKFVLQEAMGADVARQLSAFRVFRTSLRNAFVEFGGSYVNIDVLLTWGTRRFASVQVPHHKREIGTSNYTFRKLVVHTFNMVTGFSTLPLQIASVLGFILTLLGIILLFYVIFVRLIILGYDLDTFPGFTFLASVISIFSGTQLFILGIMGEYLARMHFRLMDRPSYIVRSSAHQGKNKI